MDVYKDKFFGGALLVVRVLELWERGGGVSQKRNMALSSK